MTNDDYRTWLQNALKHRRSTLISSVPLSKPNLGRRVPTQQEDQGDFTASQTPAKVVATGSGSNRKKLQDNLLSDNTDQSRRSRDVDKDEHDGILHNNASDNEAFGTAPPRRSTRKTGLGQAESTELSSNVHSPRPRAAKIAVAPSKSTYPPFKDLPESKKPWPKALLYPSTGPNRATVEFEDLYKLDDDQLLNDNLVQFGIKFAQELNPRRSDKIYVFNTYFYTSLTNGRSLNYDAVKRWTAKIDIFQFDHVVVPINQGSVHSIELSQHVTDHILHRLHWYMAIICNIKKIFAKEATSIEANDNVDDDETEQLPSQVDNLSLTTDEAGVPEKINQSGTTPSSSLPEKPEVAAIARGNNQGRRRKIDPEA